MSEPILFEDAFTITDVNSAKYERVSRISATNSAIPSINTATTNNKKNATTKTEDDNDDNDNDHSSPSSPSSHRNQISLILDVNTELYPLNVNDRIQVALALTLNLDGTRDDDDGGGGGGGGGGGRRGGWRDVSFGGGGVGGERRTLADEYDYVCHGKIYRFEDGHDDDIRAFVSFGGLLLYLEGPYAKLNPLRIDHVYLLIKR